ncbi:MAG: hypothetical protein AB4352_25090 [Hormoscilla sp.]
MKAIKVMEKIDDRGKLALDEHLSIDTNQGDDDEPKRQILEDFRQAWHEAMTGQTIPVARLWEGIDDDNV